MRWRRRKRDRRRVTASLATRLARARFDSRAWSARRARVRRAGARRRRHQLGRRSARRLVSRRAVADAAARQRRQLRPALVDERRRTGLRAAAAGQRHAARGHREQQGLRAGPGDGRAALARAAGPRRAVEGGGHRLRRSDPEHRRHRDAGDRPGDEHGLPDAQELRVGHVRAGALVHGRDRPRQRNREGRLPGRSSAAPRRTSRARPSSRPPSCSVRGCC